MDNKTAIGWSIEAFKEIAMAKFSKYKKKILIAISNKDKSISEIKRELGISYKEVYRHTKELEQLKLISCNKQMQTKHNPVQVSITKVGKSFLEELK